MKFKRIIAALLVAVLTLFAFCSCGSDDACEYASKRKTKGRDISYVEMSVKDYGKVVILLDKTTAPITVENFLKLVNEGFYDGLTFHRIITEFMIQGGDPEGNGTGGAKDTIVGEFSSNGYNNDISHIRGVISMARSQAPDSASSQFFICNADASESLDGNYAAFGYVVKGMSVIDKITAEVFPKTVFAEYYGTIYHDYWAYYGNGTVDKDEDKPVIEYIKVLENYKH